jgi:hypothetical protein
MIVLPLSQFDLIDLAMFQKENVCENVLSDGVPAVFR